MGRILTCPVALSGMLVMKLELGSGRVHCPVLELAGAAELTYAGVTWEDVTVCYGLRVSPNTSEP